MASPPQDDRIESYHSAQSNYERAQLFTSERTNNHTSTLYFHTVPWYTCYTLKSTFITSTPSPTSQNLYTATPYTRTSASCTLSRTTVNKNRQSLDGYTANNNQSTTAIVADITYNRTKPHVIRFGHLDGEMEEIIMERCSFMKLRGRKKFEYHGKAYIWRQIKNWQAGNDLVLCEMANSTSIMAGEDRYNSSQHGNGDIDNNEVITDDEADQEDVSSIPLNTVVATFKRDKYRCSSKADSTRRILEIDTSRVDEVMVVATVLVMWQGIRIKKRAQARLFYAAGSG